MRITSFFVEAYEHVALCRPELRRILTVRSFFVTLSLLVLMLLTLSCLFWFSFWLFSLN